MIGRAVKKLKKTLAPTQRERANRCSMRSQAMTGLRRQEASGAGLPRSALPPDGGGKGSRRDFRLAKLRLGPGEKTAEVGSMTDNDEQRADEGQAGDGPALRTEGGAAGQRETGGDQHDGG